MNLKFADGLLAGNTCTQALLEAKKEAGTPQTIGKYTLTISSFTVDDSTKEDKASVSDITVNTEKITLPTDGWTAIIAPSCTDKP